MRGEFKLPTKLTGKPVKNSQKGPLDNDVYSSPYEIRVRPPATFVAPTTTTTTSQDEVPVAISDDVSSDDGSDDGSSKMTIIRLGRSTKDSNGLALLSEEDAEQLSRFLDN